MVLSALTILTVSIVEFSYHERVNYHLAVNAKERLQAYYLAKSALNFSKILLKKYKETEKTAASAGVDITGLTDIPLYRKYAISTESIRGLLTGNSDVTTTTPSDQKSETTEEKSDSDFQDTLKMGASMVSSDEAKKFLNFEGDFYSDISEEQAKYDLNKVGSIVSTSPSYDLRKKLLLSLLLLPKFDEAFQSHEQDAAKLVHALGDWVDNNGVINEFDNVSRGNESDIYQDIKVKNAKFMTLSEIRLVEGMNDDIFENLKGDITVYAGVDKINVCLTNDNVDDLVASMIYHYTHNAGCGSVIEYTDSKMQELTDAVIGSCPDINAMAQTLNDKLGLIDTTSDSETESTSTNNTIPGCSFQFRDLLTTDNNVFTIKAKGQIGETQLTITVVVNTTGSNAAKWTYYYYRID